MSTVCAPVARAAETAPFSFLVPGRPYWALASPPQGGPLLRGNVHGIKARQAQGRGAALVGVDDEIYLRKLRIGRRMDAPLSGGLACALPSHGGQLHPNDVLGPGLVIVQAAGRDEKMVFVQAGADIAPGPGHQTRLQQRQAGLADQLSLCGFFHGLAPLTVNSFVKKREGEDKKRTKFIEIKRREETLGRRLSTVDMKNIADSAFSPFFVHFLFRGFTLRRK